MTPLEQARQLLAETNTRTAQERREQAIVWALIAQAEAAHELAKAIESAARLIADALRYS